MPLTEHEPSRGPDLGFTHVALTVRDAAASISFYSRFADMQVVHRRTDRSGHVVVWLGDLTRPFVVVLIEADAVTHVLGGWTHLGVALPSRDEVDRRAARAAADGHRVLGPYDEGPPVGYWAIIVDPDGHNLELSYGQEVEFSVTDATEHRAPS